MPSMPRTTFSLQSTAGRSRASCSRTIFLPSHSRSPRSVLAQWGFREFSTATLEMLFVDATRRSGGIGSALLTHAIGELAVNRVDVNEQNEAAPGFYVHRGFDVVGRSETDEAGRPYPLLHMRLRDES